MSGKRPSLAESLRQAVESDPAAAAMTFAPASQPKTALVTSEPDQRPVGFYAATRAGKKKVTAALDPAIHKQLKGLAVTRDTTTEALLIEAIHDLFRKYGGT